MSSERKRKGAGAGEAKTRERIATEPAEPRNDKTRDEPEVGTLETPRNDRKPKRGSAGAGADLSGGLSPAVLESVKIPKAGEIPRAKIPEAKIPEAKRTAEILRETNVLGSRLV